MHKSTKITPVLRKEIFSRWKTAGVSQRQLAKEYHVDKRVIGRIVERGKTGDFDVHSSVNKRFLKKPSKRTPRPKASGAKKVAKTPAKKTPRKTTARKRTVGKKK